MATSNEDDTKQGMREAVVARLEGRSCKHRCQLPQLLCPAAHIRSHALIGVVNCAGQPSKRIAAAVFRM